MRCMTARKQISDRLDGALRAGKSRRLEAHLKACPACRAYQKDLRLIQAGAGLPEPPTASFWPAFEQSLEAKLDAAAAGRRMAGIPSPLRWRWAWATGSILALAAAAIWVALLRPRTGPSEAWLLSEDILTPLLQEAAVDPELERGIDREIEASIRALAPVPGTDAPVLPAEDPLFWEGLNDEELRAIVKELEEDSGRGGPL